MQRAQLPDGRARLIIPIVTVHVEPSRKLRRLSVGGLELDESLGPGGVRELEADDLCTVFMDR